MTSLEAKHELIRSLEIVESIIEKEIDNHSEIDYKEWFNKLEVIIKSHVDGLKRLCFDNGEIHLFQKMSDDILGYWSSIKNKATEMIQ